MALPLRCKNPPDSLPIGTCILIFANLVVYGLTSNGLMIHPEIAKVWGVSHENFSLVHMFSSMFLHGSVLHLVGNMWFLYLFGFAVEGRMRTPLFLALYFLSGLAGDGMHEMIVGHLYPTMPSIGASGAIMGVMGAAIYLFPFSPVQVLWQPPFSYGWPEIVDWPMWGIGAYYLGFDILWALLGARDGVGHFAHIGGALAGVLICLVLRTRRDDQHVSEVKAMLSETKDLGVMSPKELQALYVSNPSNPLVPLHWMDQSLRRAGGVTQECSDAFFSAYPKMLKEIDLRSIAPVMIGLSQGYRDLVKPKELVDLATRLEVMGEKGAACQLYEIAIRDPRTADSDLESATYRIGLISDTVFHNADRAVWCYQQVLTRWPMGPFADQARARLQAIQQTASRPHV